MGNVEINLTGIVQNLFIETAEHFMNMRAIK